MQYNFFCSTVSDILSIQFYISMFCKHRYVDLIYVNVVRRTKIVDVVFLTQNSTDLASNVSVTSAVNMIAQGVILTPALT